MADKQLLRLSFVQPCCCLRELFPEGQRCWRDRGLSAQLRQRRFGDGSAELGAPEAALVSCSIRLVFPGQGVRGRP